MINPLIPCRKSYKWYVICLRSTWSYTILLHVQYWIYSTIDHYMRKINQSHAHIKTIKIHTFNTVIYRESLKLKTPLSIYSINHREHVSITHTKLLTSSQYNPIATQQSRTKHSRNLDRFSPSRSPSLYFAIPAGEWITMKFECTCLAHAILMGIYD